MHDQSTANTNDATTTQSPQTSFWLRNSPKVNPKLWNVLNGICFVASLLLLLELVVFEEGPIDSLEYGLPLYAFYNFSTTAVWCLESSMSLSYTLLVESSHRRVAAEAVVHTILLLVALYFLVSSIDLFQDMSTKSPDEMDENTLDVIINAVFYGLALAYVWWEQHRQNNTQIELSSGDGHTDLL